MKESIKLSKSKDKLSTYLEWRRQSSAPLEMRFGTAAQCRTQSIYAMDQKLSRRSCNLIFKQPALYYNSSISITIEIMNI